jgi:hypothetical protein
MPEVIDTVEIYKGARVSVHRTRNGTHFLVTPKGLRVTVDPKRPDVFACCAEWMGITIAELAALLESSSRAAAS